MIAFFRDHLDQSDQLEYQDTMDDLEYKVKLEQSDNQ
jgi:hypothetical protein